LAHAGCFHSLTTPLDPDEVRQSLGFVRAAENRRSAKLLSTVPRTMASAPAIGFRHMVFGIWPLEFHPDHRPAAMLAYNAWLASGMRFAFYFCETPEASEMTVQ
jgi:hypothetical protein